MRDAKGKKKGLLVVPPSLPIKNFFRSVRVELAPPPCPVLLLQSALMGENEGICDVPQEKEGRNKGRSVAAASEKESRISEMRAKNEEKKDGPGRGSGSGRECSCRGASRWSLWGPRRRATCKARPWWRERVLERRMGLEGGGGERAGREGFRNGSCD